MDGKDGGKRLKERKLFKCGKNSVVGAESLGHHQSKSLIVGLRWVRQRWKQIGDMDLGN